MEKDIFTHYITGEKYTFDEIVENISLEEMEEYGFYYPEELAKYYIEKGIFVNENYSQNNMPQ